MPYLQTVPPQEAAGEVKALYDTDLAAQGFVANYTQAFSLRPEVLRAWQALKDAITAGMEPRLFELATVAAATAIRSSYCGLVHGRILADSYCPAEAVASIAEGAAAETLDVADAAAVRLARKVAEEAEKVTQEDIEELRDLGFSDDDIFSVILAAAARCFSARCSMRQVRFPTPPCTTYPISCVRSLPSAGPSRHRRDLSSRDTLGDRAWLSPISSSP